MILKCHVNINKKYEKYENIYRDPVSLVKSFNYLRAEKIRQDATKFFTEELEVTEINEYIRNETFRIIMHALEDLPFGSRNVFSRAIQGYSAKEIADELGIAVETVKKQKQVARRILKEKLGNLFSLFFLVG